MDNIIVVDNAPKVCIRPVHIPPAFHLLSPAFCLYLLPIPRLNLHLFIPPISLQPYVSFLSQSLLSLPISCSVSLSFTQLLPLPPPSLLYNCRLVLTGCRSCGLFWRRYLVDLAPLSGGTTPWTRPLRCSKGRVLRVLASERLKGGPPLLPSFPHSHFPLSLPLPPSSSQLLLPRVLHEAGGGDGRGNW